MVVGRKSWAGRESGGRLTLLLLAAAALGGCGATGDAERVDRTGHATAIRGDTLTVFASLPAHGVAAARARDARVGMQVALAAARHRAGGRRIRLVVLPSTRPGDRYWNDSRVIANARLAAASPSTIAYIGELDLGGSSVSLPVTNRAGILQVSPADGLTSLGRMLSYETIDRSQRYEPSGRITFVRLVPPDLDSARRIAEALARRQSRRIVVLRDGGVADRELGRLVVAEMRDDLDAEFVRVPVGAGTPAGVAERAAAARPDAILYVGASGARAGAALAALAARLPHVPVIGGPQLSTGEGMQRVTARACAWSGVPAPSSLPPRGRRLLAALRREAGRPLSTYALLGHAAMRLTLNAIDRAGPNPRGVVNAARANVDWDEVAVGYGLGNGAHVEPLAVACLPLAEGEVAPSTR